jgi:WAHD domain of WASH complex
MINRDLQTETTLLLPSIDFYQKSYQRQVIQNCSTLQKVSTDYYAKLGAKIDELGKRSASLKDRGNKASEIIQNLFGAKSIIRIETPKQFPSDIDYNVLKVSSDLLKADTTIPKNEALLAQLLKNTEDNFSLHDTKLKGEEPKVSNAELNDGIKATCQTNRVPLIYPINIQQQNGHLDKLYQPRTHHTKKKMKYIDSSLIFNTKNSVFYHYIPDRLAEKRNRSKTTMASETNPILESGNLTNFNSNLQRHDDALDSGYVPKTTTQITLLDAPEDNMFGDNVMDMNFLSDKSNALFGGDTNFYFDDIISQQPVQQSQASTNISITSNTNSGAVSNREPQSNQSTGQSGQSGSVIPPPPIMNAQPVPPPAPGSIPPPPPLAMVQNLANAKGSTARPSEDEGGNVPNESANLKPITEEKSRYD